MSNDDATRALSLATQAGNQETANILKRWIESSNKPGGDSDGGGSIDGPGNDALRCGRRERGDDKGSFKVTQDQYQWAVTCGEILQQMLPEDRNEAWSAMSIHERAVYNRVMKERCLMLAQQLSSMTGQEQTDYWRNIPTDQRAQYEQVTQENIARLFTDDNK